MKAKTERLYVTLSASQTRRRLRGIGLGVKKVESAGRQRAAIVHTATGAHLRELQSIFQDVMESEEQRVESIEPENE